MEVSLGDAIKQFLRESRIGNSIKAIQIKEVWEQIMGSNYFKLYFGNSDYKKNFIHQH